MQEFVGQLDESARERAFMMEVHNLKPPVFPPEAEKARQVRFCNFLNNCIISKINRRNVRQPCRKLIKLGCNHELCFILLLYKRVQRAMTEVLRVRYDAIFALCQKVKAVFERENVTGMTE